MALKAPCIPPPNARGNYEVSFTLPLANSFVRSDYKLALDPA